MDDIRRPDELPRRSYGTPPPQPVFAEPSQAHSIPVTRVAHPHNPRQPHNAYGQGVMSAPSHHTSQPVQPAPVAHPAHHQAAAKKRVKKTPLVLGLIIAGAGLFAGGYLLKSSSPQNSLPASVTSQANFDLYFPSPMPAGYTYMKDTATFQIGQVFYKFANGTKRVTVKEEPLPQPKPDLSLLAGYTLFDSPIGKAAIGTTFGQPTADIITSNSVITLNTSGGVSQAELKTAIDNLKNIGQNPVDKSN